MGQNGEMGRLKRLKVWGLGEVTPALLLVEVVGEKRKVKMVSLLLPTTCLDRLQTLLSIAFDKWDTVLCSNIRTTGLEFSTRG